MNDKTEKPQQDRASPQDRLTATGRDRRRIAQAGVAAPILMTLGNRSAFAAADGACTPSAFFSINHASHHPDAEPCACGRSPGFWKTLGQGPTDLAWEIVTASCGFMPDEPVPNKGHPDCTTHTCYRIGNKWYKASGTVFSSVFPGTGINTTLVETMWALPGSIAFHAVAALANSCMPNWSSIDTADVIDIFSELIMTGGTYQGQGGVTYVWSDPNGPDLEEFFTGFYCDAPMP